MGVKIIIVVFVKMLVSNWIEILFLCMEFFNVGKILNFSFYRIIFVRIYLFLR